MQSAIIIPEALVILLPLSGKQTDNLLDYSCPISVRIAPIRKTLPTDIPVLVMQTSARKIDTL